MAFSCSLFDGKFLSSVVKHITDDQNDSMKNLSITFLRAKFYHSLIFVSIFLLLSRFHNKYRLWICSYVLLCSANTQILFFSSVLFVCEIDYAKSIIGRQFFLFFCSLICFSSFQFVKKNANRKCTKITEDISALSFELCQKFIRFYFANVFSFV